MVYTKRKPFKKYGLIASGELRQLPFEDNDFVKII